MLNYNTVAFYGVVNRLNYILQKKYGSSLKYYFLRKLMSSKKANSNVKNSI